MKRLLPLLVLSLVMLQSFLPAAMVAGTQSASVSTGSATNIGSNSATLNADIIPTVSMQKGLILVSNTSEELGPLAQGDCTVRFQYGRQSGVYTHTTAPITITSIGFRRTLSTTVTTLDPCTRYYVRAMLTCPWNMHNVNYQPGPAGYLFSLFSTGSHSTGMHGLGVGLGADLIERNLSNITSSSNYGNEITFTTTGCQIGPLGQGGSVGTGSTAISTTGPIQIANIVVQSAVIATPKAAPGEKVDVTASVTNKGSSNGDAKVTLYVNGQEVESQGITLSSGQTAPLHFYLSRNEPGTYSVTVGGVSAGSFTVDTFANNDSLIYGIIALFTIGIAAVIYMVTRKRTA